MHTDFDVAIVGAGPVGLALAGFLALRYGKSLAHRIAVFDAKPAPCGTLNETHDARILALSEASRLRLASLGFPKYATSIHSIHISRQGGFGLVRLHAKAHHMPALGYTVAYVELTQVLSQVVHNLGVTMHWSTLVMHAADSSNTIIQTPAQTYTCLLRVDAEGGLFQPEQQFQVGQNQTFLDYQQSALIGHAVLKLDPKLTQQGNIAFERFTAEGPLAFLPIEALCNPNANTQNTEQFYTWVWCAKPESIAKALAQQGHAPSTLAQHFERIMHGRCNISNIRILGQYPLGLHQQALVFEKRCVKIGNAAQKLHPVAGQGFNLGLRDALQLSKVFCPERFVDDAECAVRLKRYADSRQCDRTVLRNATHLLASGFAKPVLRNVLGGLLAGMGASGMAQAGLVQTLLYGFMAPDFANDLHHDSYDGFHAKAES